MSNQLQLKFPTGEFTHSELAAFNGKTNQQVWTAYQQAIKEGIIVSAGERPGKGKPSKIWKVSKPEYASNEPVTISAPVKPVTQPKPVIQKVVPVVVEIKPNSPEEKRIEQVVASRKETLSKADTNALLVTATTSEPDDTLEIEPAPTVERRNVPQNPRVKADMLCPFCHKPCVAWDDETGVMVSCVQPVSVCPVSENPYGHGRTEKAAFEILLQKYKK